MKYNNYIKMICLFMLMFISINSVNAECTSKEKNRLYKLASNIKLNYSYEEQYDELQDIHEVIYSVLISGLSEELYVKNGPVDSDMIYNKSMENEGVITVFGVYSGVQKFYVYPVDNQCNEVIKTINLTIPKFNYHYYDELCDGIQKEFSLCDKWYQGDISYEIFKKKALAYRDGLEKIDNSDLNSKKINTPWYKLASEFVLKFYIYFIILAIILIGLIIFGVIKYKEKRSDF